MKCYFCQLFLVEARVVENKIINKLKVNNMPFVNKNKCTGCGACVNVCPVGAISMKDGKAVIDQEKCIKCGKCLDVCPQGAISSNSESQDLKQGGGGLGLGRGRGRGMGQGRGRGFGGRR